MIARVATLPQGRPKKGQIGPFITVPEAAKMMNVGTVSLKRARLVLEKGDA